MRIWLEWGDRRDGITGDLEEHHSVFNIRAILSHCEAVHRLSDLQKRKDLPHGNWDHGRGLRKADQHNHEKRIELHTILAQSGRTCPMQEWKDAQQFHLQLPGNFTAVLPLPQNWPSGRYLLRVILRAIGQQAHFNELFPWNCLPLSTQKVRAEVSRVLDICRTVLGIIGGLRYRGREDYQLLCSEPVQEQESVRAKYAN